MKYISQFSNKVNPKKYQHIFKVVHIFKDKNLTEYQGTQIQILNKEPINVVLHGDMTKKDDWWWLYDSLQNKLSTIKNYYKKPSSIPSKRVCESIDVEFKKAYVKKPVQAKKEKIVINDSSFKDQWPEILRDKSDFVIDPNDKVYFNLTHIKKAFTGNLGNVRFVPRMNRPCNYVDNLDSSNRNILDSNSAYIYFDIPSIKKMLQKKIYHINHTNSDKVYRSSIRSLAQTLADYTLALFYINTSYGEWSLENLMKRPIEEREDFFWELCMVFLQKVKPMNIELYWVRGCTMRYMKYLVLTSLSRRLGTGYFKFLLNNASKMLVYKYTRRMYPSGFKGNSREDFKQSNQTNKESSRKERNNQILELYKQGTSVSSIASQLNLSRQHIYRIIQLN